MFLFTEAELSILSKVIFLDRDGVINKKACEHDYIKQWKDFFFLPNVEKAIKEFNELGYIVLIVTNQRGIAKRLLTRETLDEIHRNMQNHLQLFGAHIDKIYVCPHDLDECDCRKPKIGLFLEAEKDFSIDKNQSWMIGDSSSDMIAGQNYKLKTIYISDHDIYETADYNCRNLYDTVNLIRRITK